MEHKTAKIIAIALKVFICFVGSLVVGLLREFKVGALWVVLVVWGILWALFYKWENLLVKTKGELIKYLKYWWKWEDY